MTKKVISLDAHRASATQRTPQASAYRIYLNSLALSGRKPMTSQLNIVCRILEHQQAAEDFSWNAFSFEQAHLVRSTMLDLGYAVNTINLALAGLRGIAKTAFNLDQMSGDDMLRINAVKNVKGSATRVGRNINRKEIKQLLKNCNKLSNPEKSAREKALLMVGLGAGLRCLEISHLEINDFDRETGVLIVRKGKGRKQRQLYLAKPVINAIEQWVTVRGNHSGPLFNRIRRYGVITQEQLCVGGITHAIKTVQQVAKTEPFTPHDMRRSFITDLLETGTDINIVRQLAGHSDVSMTVRYDRRDITWQKLASQSIKF